MASPQHASDATSRRTTSASDATAREPSSLAPDPPGSGSRTETSDSSRRPLTPAAPGDDSGESPAGVNGSSCSIPIIKSSPSVTWSSELEEHSYPATAAENDGGPEPEDAAGQHRVRDERSVDRERPKRSDDDVHNQSGGSLKVTVVTTSSETPPSDPGAPPRTGSEESPAGADEFFFFQSSASDAIKVVSGDAANLNTSKEELEVVVGDEYDHLPGSNSKTGASYLPRFESLEGVAESVTGLQRWIAYTAQDCLDRGQRSIFDRYDDEDVATNPNELLNVSAEDGVFETMEAGCDAITSWGPNLNDSGEDGGPRGALGRISGRIPTSCGSISSLADEVACGDDVLLDDSMSEIPPQENGGGSVKGGRGGPGTNRHVINGWGIDAEKFHIDKLIDVVDDAISGKVCSMDYECGKGGLDDEYELDASLDDESERTQAAPTVQQLSAIKRRNVSLQSQLSATARQLSSLKGRNDDLLSEVMQLHRQLETTKGRSSGRVSSLQRELEAERRRAERAEARAAAALEAERSRADAAEEDAAFALEVARNARTVLRESGRRMKLDGKWWEGSEPPPPNGGEGTNDAEGGRGVPSEPAAEGMAALENMVKDYADGVEDVLGRLREKISWRRR